MINGNYSVTFGAKFDKAAYKKIMNSTQDPHTKRAIDHTVNIIKEWGDKNSVISIEQNPHNNLHRFVLKNDKFGKKTGGLTYDFTDKGILSAFFDIKKSTIEYIEKLIKQYS